MRASSFERIHRSNLVGMGVPCQLSVSVTVATLGLTGNKTFDVLGLNDLSKPRQPSPSSESQGPFHEASKRAIIYCLRLPSSVGIVMEPVGVLP